jgi:hypothetical protein
MFVNRSGQNEQSLERTFHRRFLSSFTSFGWEVSEEKIKMWKVNGRQTTDAKWWQKLPLPLARWVKNLNDNQMTIYVPFPFNLFLVSEKKIVFIFPYGTMLNLQLFSYSWLIFHIQKAKSSYTTLLQLFFPIGMKLFAKMFQFYCGNQLYWWRISEYPEKNTELLQVTISLHKVVPSTHRCVLEWYSMKYL